ncbi:hypothetical protein QE429_003872 [Bacillus sp. SORGH_AS 510]|uniref:hypothetical protein n=1 Tax=Bacillus sp. SORGH_AS_0510 TaxID=3041771 RepID=UPI0027875162|nr:hypothetical protein [Bacillus sp. SORGH_AS_0510]MDQ1147045.1 hypothetical protein [Bacillus sp. SORGH_AS_0510]
MNAVNTIKGTFCDAGDIPASSTREKEVHLSRRIPSMTKALCEWKHSKAIKEKDG